MRLAFLFLFLPTLCWGQLTLAGKATLAGAVTVQPEVAWSPTNLGSGLKIWLRNTSVSGNNGDAFKYWADSSGNNNWASNSAATTYVTNTGTFATGVKSVYFDAGANTQLWLTNAGGVSRNIASMTILLVMNLGDTATSKAGLFFSRGDVVNSARGYMQFATSESMAGYGRQIDGGSGFPSTASSVLQLSKGQVIHMDLDWAGGSSRVYAWTNNVSVIDSAWFASGSNTPDTDSLQVILGGVGNAEYLKGYVAEVLCVVPKVSAADRTNLWNYAKTLINE